MRNIFILLFLITCNVSLYAQEFNANVVVNAQLTGNENLQQFKTLENQLKEFISKNSKLSLSSCNIAFYRALCFII